MSPSKLQNVKSVVNQNKILMNKLFIKKRNAAMHKAFTL
uniref:Uncharacterized protein n=1 Tax=Rhizophora mucronata TaxID=61149 RepID=A0A2P2J0Q7_RHIMU